MILFNANLNKMKRKYKILFILLFIILILYIAISICSNNSDKMDEKDCNNNGIQISCFWFNGFKLSEIDTVKVIVRDKNNVIIDSTISMFTSSGSRYHDSLNGVQQPYSIETHLLKEYNSKNNFEIRLKDGRVYTVKNIKTQIVTHYAGCSRYMECKTYSYKLNDSLINGELYSFSDYGIGIYNFNNYEMW